MHKKEEINPIQIMCKQVITMMEFDSELSSKEVRSAWKKLLIVKAQGH